MLCTLGVTSGGKFIHLAKIFILFPTDGVQMVQEVQTVQAVEAVETMPKIMLCGYCNAPFTKKHYLTEHMSQLHSN